jgi:RimJ/RimL family protein N-acetyltransferase
LNEQTFDLPLEGARLMVRAFAEADITPLYIGWLNDPDVVRYSNQRFIEHSADSCRRYWSSFAGTANLFLAIEDKATGRLIGTMTVYRSLQHETADIGIMVGDKAVWGQHFGLEAFSLVVEALMASGAIRKATAGTMARNVGMVRIMERAGMGWEATRRGQELLDGEPVDLVYYAKFRHD